MRGVTEPNCHFLPCERFQLTRLMRGVTRKKLQALAAKKFQLTRLMRGVTDSPLEHPYDHFISTHTPHARRDSVKKRWDKNNSNFNSHASCEA